MSREYLSWPVPFDEEILYVFRFKEDELDSEEIHLFGNEDLFGGTKITIMVPYRLVTLNEP